MSGAAKAKAKRKRQPVYFVVRRLVDPATGEEVGALVPQHEVDRQLMRERSYITGSALRAQLSKARNVKFHRLAHQLGVLIAENIDGYDGLGGHEALKRMQAESGVACDETRTPVHGLGVLVSRRAQSLAFDEMDEGEFGRFFDGICRHIVAVHWPHMDPEAILEMTELMGA